jgi:hypothetical protein
MPGKPLSADPGEGNQAAMLLLFAEHLVPFSPLQQTPLHPHKGNGLAFCQVVKAQAKYKAAK